MFSITSCKLNWTINDGKGINYHYIYLPKFFIYYLYNKCLPVGFNGATVWTVVFTVVEEDVDKDDWASPFGY